MELDRRILPGKYILTCFNAKEAEQFVGQMGYAADDISMFADLDYIDPGKLEYVIPENGNSICYPYTVVNDSARDQFAFFLPAAWVQSAEEQEQFAHDSLDLALLINNYLIHHAHPSEIMKQHAHERNKFLRDVFERILSGAN